MNEDELTLHFEELKKELEGKISDEQLKKELNTYLNEYRVTPDAAKRGIKRKYGAEGATSSFVTADVISKKISELQGTEMNVDITAKAVYVDKKQITVRGSQKIIVSGILGDETGTAPFTIWEGDEVELEKGETYLFKNAYTKKWNDRVQINLGSRGKVEKSTATVDVPDRTLVMDSTEMKIGDIKEGTGNVTVTGRIMSVEERNITVKGEARIVYSGLIADDSGKIQYSAWNDYDLKEGETICVKNAYIRAWRGIPQLNLGDKCEVSRVDDSFGEIDMSSSKKTIADIIRIGGGLDVSVTGTVVDLRAGSGLIRRCPECNRSVLNEECTTHGQIEPVFDLRMKLILDDGTGAISAIVNRQDTELLTGITLEAAEGLAKARGDAEIVAREVAQLMIMKKISVGGNVLSDDYGPMMIVREVKLEDVDILKEAEELYEELEAAL